MVNQKPKSFRDLDSWKNRGDKKEEYSQGIESKVSKYSRPPAERTEIFSSEGEDYFNVDLSPDVITRINSDSRVILRNNKNLEQKIKAELAGSNIFKKGKHVLRTISSKDYREQSADELINEQLKISSGFRDSIKSIYLRLENDLNKNTENISNLEKDYFRMINERENVKEEIKTSQKDYQVLKKASGENKGIVEKEKLKIGTTNANRAYRKAISKLDELNNSIVENIKEREMNYTSEVIFERYGGAFKKIYETSENEIRKINHLKSLYLDVMRGGKVVRSLEKSFEDVFSSLRIMDDVLIGGINSIVESSSGKGRINDLREEKSRNSRELLDTMRESYIPSAEKLNAIVENYTKKDVQR